jgi:hypothetical protein
MSILKPNKYTVLLSDPDVAFVILKNTSNGIVLLAFTTCAAIQQRECTVSLIKLHKLADGGSYPQSSFFILTQCSYRVGVLDAVVNAVVIEFPGDAAKPE